MPTNDMILEQLANLERKVDKLTDLVANAPSANKSVEELYDEMAPVAKAVMDDSVEKLSRFEELGYFDFARTMVEMFERVVETHEPDTLLTLGDHSADLLLVLKLLSQPRMLALGQDIATDFETAGSDPVEALGAMKRLETEKDIQRGLGFVMDMLGIVGRSVSRAPRLSRRGTTPSAPSRPRAAQRPARSTGTQVQPAKKALSFVSDEEWSEDYAQQVAEQLEVGSLTEPHWTVIRFSRNDYKESQKAPNIRRITQLTGVSTREIYTLFPKSPGPTISQIAGVPKPAGCL